MGYLDFQLMLVSRNLGYLDCPLKVSFYEHNPEISIEDALEGGRVHLQFRRSFNSADIRILEELIERLCTVQLADGQDRAVWALER